MRYSIQGFRIALNLEEIDCRYKFCFGQSQSGFRCDKVEELANEVLKLVGAGAEMYLSKAKEAAGATLISKPTPLYCMNCGKHRACVTAATIAGSGWPN
jgi:hypothetical protein